MCYGCSDILLLPSGGNWLDPEAPLEMSQAFIQVSHINMINSLVNDDVKKG